MLRLLLSLALYLIVFAEDPNAGVIKVIQEQCIEAADAVSKIKISTPQDKLQIASMANDCLLELYSGVNALNSAIPNADSRNSRAALTYVSDLLARFASRIEWVYVKNPKKLKETLVSILKETSAAISHYNKYFDDVNNHFGNIAIARLDFFQLLGVLQLKYEAMYFTKTNEELVSETETSKNAFGEVLENTQCTDEKACEKELRRIYIRGSILIQRYVYDLLFWVAVNPDSPDAESVKDVAVILSKQYSRLVETAAQVQDYSTLKSELGDIYDTCLAPIQGLASVTYANNTGGLEFIRSVLFHAVAVGYEFALHFEAALSG